MLTIHSAMLVILGFLLAALLVLALIGPYRRRIQRFAFEQIKRSLPLTESEIRADKDGIRAQYAIAVHKLEMKLEDASLAAARQSVEINRREAKINDLEQAISTHKLTVEEHENARRVLEQAIVDRLPKVEQRLTEARRLLVERDREIALLSDTAEKQTAALKETTQLNNQQSDELERLRAALKTRAARNREALGDPRFDGEVALRTELEMLRARSRDQQALINRLQSSDTGEADAASEQGAGEIERLKSALARVEAELQAAKASGDAASFSQEASEARIRDLESAERDRAAEIASLKASLKTYEDAAAAGTSESRPMSAKAEISALQAEVDEQRRTIQTLRAEVAANNERLARQAQHFRDELRRLGTQPAGSAAEGWRAEVEASRKSLAERISAPRSPRVTPVEPPVAAANDADAQVAREQRSGTFLKALNGGAVTEAASGEDTKDDAPVAAAASESKPRRARLLDRISNLDKN